MTRLLFAINQSPWVIKTEMFIAYFYNIITIYGQKKNIISWKLDSFVEDMDLYPPVSR